jgi:type I restriction enzyme S subunit
MSSEWRIATVEELAAPYSTAMATGPFGSSISSKFFTDAGTPVIRGSNLSAEVSTRLIDDGLVFVSNEKAAEFQRSVARRGDLVFTCWGTINQIGLIDARSKFQSYIVSNKQMKLTVDPLKTDARFIYYVFSGPEKQAEILDNGIGSSVPGFNLGQLKRHEILLPPLPEQIKIADTLELLDNRIAILREANATLEAIAQALFKSWFVDFGPVRAKMEGRAPEGMDEVTAALFPDRFEESELGLVPLGWARIDLAKLTKGFGGSIQTGPFGSQLHASDYIQSGIPVVMPKDIVNRRASTESIARIGAADADRLARHKLQVGDIVFSRRGDVERHALITEREVGWLCGTGCLLLRPGPKWSSPGFLSMLLDEAQARTWLVQHAVGATMPNLNTGILGSVPVVLPSTSVLGAFEELLSLTEEQRSRNASMAENLASIRDTLLPRLISGQLRVKQPAE